MVAEPIQLVVRRYLEAVRQAGIRARQGVVFGSYARGEANEWSDIDLVVIAPELDDLTDRRLLLTLWELRAKTDSRIEPIPCGEREWENDTNRPILEIARREGVVIAA
ncbi:MAG: nucleotidyltransferase domain-containing protein [Candidatus Sumerlaeota bacterium]|nr:nucleotidyltransferase domain-containing protein [Candidatus Sumerlaeota bacterium]